MDTPKRSFTQSTGFKIGVGILCLLLFALVFLPQLSSTTWFNSKVKQVVNEKIPGTLDFSSLSLSWLYGVEIQKIVYRDQAQGVNVTADQMSTNKGLLALAANYKNVGVVNIDNPKITVTLDKPEADGKFQSKASTPPKKASETDQKYKKSQQGSLLSLVQVQLKITNGSLVTVSSDNPSRTVIKDFDFNLNFDGKKGMANYRLFFQDESGAGQVAGEGIVTLPQDTILSVEEIESDGVLKIRNWQIAELLSIVESQFDGVGGEGILNGKFHITGSGASVIGVIGNLSGQDIKLYGDPLLSDTPEIDAFTLDIGVQKRADTLEIEKLEIQSPFLTATVSGTAQKQQARALTTRATVDVAEILSQFPQTLNLKEGVFVSEGKITIDADLSSIDGVAVFAVNAHLQHLVGVAEKTKISWKEPVDITIKGQQTSEAINVDQFTVQSAFLQANGSGNSEKMQIKLATDIGAALQELEKFIDLSGWSSDGKLDFNLDIVSKGDNLRAVTGNVVIDGFELRHNTTMIHPASSLTAKLTSIAELDSQLGVKEIGATEFIFSTRLGQGTVAGESFIVGSNERPAVLKNVIAKGNFDLERVTTLLHSLGTLSQEESVMGLLQYDARVTGENIEKLHLDLAVNVSPFSFHKKEKILSDEKITLELLAVSDLKQKSCIIDDLKFSTTPLSLAASGILSPQGDEQVFSSQGITNINFTALSDQFKAFAGVELEMSGVSEKPFELQASTVGGAWIDTLQYATFSTFLHVEQINGHGLSIESFDLPVQLENSLLDIGLDAQVNGGSMVLHPKIDFAGKSPVATLPDNSTIFKEVGLTEEMSSDLLAKIHPLFTGVSSTAGTIDLQMQHLKWPTDKQLQDHVSFSGAFIFNDVKLQAGSLMTPLLAAMKVDESEIQIVDQPVTFVGEDGRVICSALEATVNEYSLILEGSVGFDQTLDYTVKMPVTEKMVSGDVYKYLEGTFITVPITGTVSKPSVNNAFIQKALGDLALQAGKKQFGDQAEKLLHRLFQ